jgi:carbon monoxide dehydrogenase subunit G
MAHAEASVFIERPVAEVFQFLLDGENNMLWRSSVLSIKKKSDTPAGVGAVFVQEARGPFGRRIRGDYEVVECEKDKKIAFQVIAGPARPRGTFAFEPQGKGTKLTFTLDFGPKGLFRLMGPMIQSQMRKEVGALVNIKKHLESRT